MSDKKILFISGTSIISGAEYVLADYVRRSRKRGCITIACPPQGDVRNFYEKLGVNVIVSSSLGQTGAAKTKTPVSVLAKTAKYAASFFFLPRVIKKTGVVICAGNNTGDVIFALPSKLAGVKYINLVHDMIIKKSIQAFAVKFADKFVDRYVAVCGAVKQSLVNAGIDASKIEVIYNGIEKKKIIRRSKGGPLTAGYAGLVEQRKNTQEFVSIVEHMRFEGINLCGIMACGKSSQGEYARKVLESAARSGIKILNGVKREHMGDFYGRIDFLVVPSINDALPTVIMEAFRAGVPVVGRRTGGIPEMIDDGGNGILYDGTEDFERISLMIKKKGRAGLAAMGEKGRRTAAKKFYIGEKAKKMDALLFGKGLKNE